MNVMAVAAISLDGKIAYDHSHQIVTSPEDKAYFKEVTMRAGVVITGRQTFDLFKAGPMKDRLNVVYTNRRELLDQPADDRAWFTNESPDAVLRKLEEKGFDEVAVIGGETIFTMFNKADLIDEWHLTVCPEFIGESGIPLIKDFDATKFKTIDRKLWDSGETLLILKGA